MKFFVCVKQVPDTETKIKVGADGKSLDATNVKWVMNPYDEFAVEEGIKLRDANAGSQLWVVSVGPKKRVVETVRTALAMGADEGIVVDAPENTDPLQTAAALAKTISAEGGANMIFSGKLAIDDNASSVSQMLAEFLNIPHVTVVSKFTKDADGATVERDAEGGAKEIVQVKGTAVIGANKGLNNPRYASLPGIMKAKKKVIKEIDFASLGLDIPATTSVTKLDLPPEKPAVQMIQGDPAAQAKTLVGLLRDQAKVL
jgi:electron transfer flavoprotein beta subunit